MNGIVDDGDLFGVMGVEYRFVGSIYESHWEWPLLELSLDMPVTVR